MDFFRCIGFIAIMLYLTNCNSPKIIEVERSLIIRDYYPQDSLMYDKLIFKDGKLYSWNAVPGLGKMYLSDSILSGSKWKRFRIDIDKNNYIEILDTFKIATHKHTFDACKYLMVSTRSNIELVDFGIYIQGLGTVHYRGYHSGYHSGRIINLYTANSSSVEWINPTITNYIIDFLSDSILHEPMPPIDQKAIDEEIEGEIEFDTTQLY